MSVFTQEVNVDNVPDVTISAGVSVNNFPVDNALTNTQLRASPVPISGTVTALVGVGSTATITRVATSASSALLLAANASRKKAVIMTESGSTNYVAFAATATATAYTYLLGTNTVLEVTNYTGAISLIRSSGSGNVQVTEIV